MKRKPLCDWCEEREAEMELLGMDLGVEDPWRLDPPGRYCRPCWLAMGNTDVDLDEVVAECLLAAVP